MSSITKKKNGGKAPAAAAVAVSEEENGGSSTTTTTTATTTSRDTINVARGTTTYETNIKKRKYLQKQIVSTFNPKEKSRYQAYLHRNAIDPSNTDYLGTSRDSGLSLNETQKRALDRRIKDKRRRDILSSQQTHTMEAAVRAAEASSVLETQSTGYIEPENDMERTFKVTQKEMKQHHLDEQTSRHIYDLKLVDYAPYALEYELSGRHSLLLGKRGGHVAMMDNYTQSLQCEMHLGENVRDATFLHNHTLFAVAQQNYVYIYDEQGSEVHMLDEHVNPLQVQFLPYHWLLATVGKSGWIKYQDTSTGTQVSQHRTKLGPCHVMRQNTQNAIIHCGHGNGAVTLWSPASREYLVKMQCHRSPILSMAIDSAGRYMATSGVDRDVKLWDLRMYKELYSLRTVNKSPATTLDFSQRGVLGAGHGTMSTFWNHPMQSPPWERSSGGQGVQKSYSYMQHRTPGKTIESLRFRPYEDVCGLGHSSGISSIVIPGSGDPNLDTLEAGGNPYGDVKQHREAVVRSLLDKLQPGMISLDTNMVGRIHRGKREEGGGQEAGAADANANDEENGDKVPEKNRARGRNKLGKKLARKERTNTEKRIAKVREAREKEEREEEEKKHGGSKKKKGRAEEEEEEEKEHVMTEQEKKKAEAPSALKRFF